MFVTVRCSTVGVDRSRQSYRRSFREVSHLVRFRTRRLPRSVPQGAGPDRHPHFAERIGCDRRRASAGGRCQNRVDHVDHAVGGAHVVLGHVAPPTVTISPSTTTASSLPANVVNDCPAISITIAESSRRPRCAPAAAWSVRRCRRAASSTLMPISPRYASNAAFVGANTVNGPSLWSESLRAAA